MVLRASLLLHPPLHTSLPPPRSTVTGPTRRGQLHVPGESPTMTACPELVLRSAPFKLRPDTRYIFSFRPEEEEESLACVNAAWQRR